MPPTPQQSSRSSIEDLQWQTEIEEQGSSWSSREKKLTAQNGGLSEKHDNVKVEVEELELMLSSEDSEVNLRYVLMNASRWSSKIV